MFEKGDIIKGVGTRYAITNYKATMLVTKADSSRMDVFVLEHHRDCYMFTCYNVENSDRHFIKVDDYKVKSEDPWLITKVLKKNVLGKEFRNVFLKLKNYTERKGIVFNDYSTFKCNVLCLSDDLCLNNISILKDGRGKVRRIIRSELDLNSLMELTSDKNNHNRFLEYYDNQFVGIEEYKCD